MLPQTKLGVVVLAFAVALSGAALVGPWWVVSSAWRGHSGGTNSTALYTPLGASFSYQTYGSSATLVENASGYYAGLPAVGMLFLVALGLTAASVFAGGLAAFTLVRSEARPMLRKRATLLASVASAAALAAPVLTMLVLPGALTQDLGTLPLGLAYSGFWGSTSASRLDFSITAAWGAGWAWFLALLSALLLLGMTVWLLRGRRATGQSLGNT